jgi:hypothetical protein
VVRIGRGVEFPLMAAYTHHGRPGIHPVDVAGGATGRQMRSCQGKAGRAVSEARRLPACGRVALGAVCRKGRLHMLGTAYLIGIHLMAGHTGYRCPAVLAVLMTLSTN